MGMMTNLLNCPRCGKVYAKNIRNMCVACIKISDAELAKCNKYLKENRLVTIEELSKGTDVESLQIVRFIRDKRLSIAGAPNIKYGCEVCNESIRDGNLCAACRKKFTNNLKQAARPGAETPPENQSTFFNKNDR